MARPLRIQYEGALYHITSRGNARNPIFLSDDDRVMFLDKLDKVVSRYGWVCHAYCLMPNHYHLLVETPKPNLSRGMQLLNGVYTQSFNRARNRSGHVFQGRFKSILVEKESYLLELARYVVLNPVRAKMVHSAREWRWSSYRATAGMIDPAAFLTVDWILSQFADDWVSAISRYRRFVSQGGDFNVWTDLRAGSLLGTTPFVEDMRSVLHDRPLDPNILRREQDAARPDLADLFHGVADKNERDLRIHEAVRHHHYTLQEVGNHLGLHFSTISVIAKRIDSQQDSRIKA